MKGAPLLLVCGLLAGCMGPRPVIPESARLPVVPDQWSRSSAGSLGVSPEWWRAFQDPTLDQLVSQALAANSDVALAVARVDEAQAQFESIAAQSRPNSYVVAQGGRQRSVSAFGTAQVQTAGEAVVNANWDLDPFGRLRAARRAAAAALTATRYQAANVRLNVETAAVSGYVLLRALDTRLELLSSTRDVRADALRVAQRRLDSGYGTVLEARQAEAELRATEQQIPGVQLAITRQEHALSLLLGDMPSSIARGLTLSALPIPDPGTGVPAAWLRRRPDVAQAEAQLVAADHSLDAVRAAFLPDIQLSASGGVVDSTLLPDPIQVFSLGAGILAPLLDAGRLKAQQHGAAARRDQAAIAYRKVVLQGFRDVEDALATVQRTEEQETALVRQREAVNAALEVAQKRFREGYSPYLETIDAQRNLLGVDLALAQARNDRLIAVIYLCQSLGGGWQAESP